MATDCAFDGAIRRGSHTRAGHAAIAALAARQYGVVTRGQLIELGLGPAAIGHGVRRGALHVVHRGVYAVGHRVLRREGHWLAAVLAAGPDAVLSHRSAAALWGIGDTRRARVEVIVPRVCRRPGIDARRAALSPDEVTVECGIRVTTPARTLLDLAEVLRPQQLERAVHEAEYRRLTSPLPLAALLTRHQRRRGTTALRTIVDRHDLGATITKSELETRFLALLALLEDVVRRLQELLEARGQAALEQDRLAEPAGDLQERVVLHVARADLHDVGVLGDRVGVLRVEQLGDDRETRDLARDGQDLQRLDAETLEGERRRAWLEGAAAQHRRASGVDGPRDRHLLSHGYRVVRITWRQLHDGPATIAAELTILLADRLSSP